MTTSLVATVEQSPLATLIQQREELQETLRRLKKQLKDCADWDRENVASNIQRQRGIWKDYVERYSGYVSATQAKLEEARSFEEDRVYVLCVVTNDDLRSLLERANKELEIDRLEKDIQSYSETVRSYQENLDEPDEPIVDPRIEISNHLAVTEQALEDVQAKIKVAKRAATK